MTRQLRTEPHTDAALANVSMTVNFTQTLGINDVVFSVIAVDFLQETNGKMYPLKITLATYSVLKPSNSWQATGPATGTVNL